MVLKCTQCGNDKHFLKITTDTWESDATGAELKRLASCLQTYRCDVCHNEIDLMEE